MYIHTIDELNKKDHYTLGRLEGLKGDVQIVPSKREEKQRKREEKKQKKEEKEQKNQIAQS